MKQCSVCKEFKELDEFYKAARRKDGRQSACKGCHAVQADNSMKKKPEKYSAIRRQSYKKAVARYKEWKEHYSCSFCNEDESVCLELHHKDPSQKEFQISKLRNAKWEKFIDEVNKCVVVCSNCHRKIHAGLIDDSNVPTVGENAL